MGSGLLCSVLVCAVAPAAAPPALLPTAVTASAHHRHRWASETHPAPGPLLLQQQHQADEPVWADVRDPKYSGGAKGDGEHDDTAAFQAALTASQTVSVPPGRYRLTATLVGQPGQVIIGVTPERCVLTRNTSYGHTLTIGSQELGHHAGSIRIEGLWFYHLYAFNNGPSFEAGNSTAILNGDPASSHLKVIQGQSVRIHDCWFYGIGNGLEVVDSSLVWVDRSIFNGVWDRHRPRLQDSQAAIWAHGHSTGLMVDRCWIAGGFGPAAEVNITTPPAGGPGSVTVAKALNSGPQYGIYVQSAEEFTFTNNYIGGQSKHNIYLSAASSNGGIVAHGKISGNMLDGAGTYSVVIESTSDVTYPSFIDIFGNTAVGYGLEEGFLRVRDTGGSQIAAAYLNVFGNTMQYYYRAPIVIERARGVKLHGNTVAGINCDGVTADDPYTLAGAVFDGNCSFCDSHGNTWGGGINVRIEALFLLSLSLSPCAHCKEEAVANRHTT
jgi:hypothetical protein